MNANKVKILAPAGSWESLNAAINAGCDEVYFGIAEMNMRASAARNFTIENLQEVVNHCHENGVKACVTVNTLLYQSDLDQMRKIVDAIKETGADAAIVADMATVQYAREQNVDIHISTQLSISNIESLKFYSQFSDRVVLARELTIEQVKEMCEKIKEKDIRGPKGELVEVEVFAHGAICVAVSGRCGMSLHCYDRSANRGQCGQTCRRKYKITDESTGQELVIDNNYVMSAADLCTIGMLDKLVDAGVAVLKFEGRGRSPEYVDLVIKTYKEALECIEEGTYDQKKILKWNQDLGTVFNRGLSGGFYMGRQYDEWAGIRGSKATKEKVRFGVVERYYPKIGIAQVIVKDKIDVEVGIEYIITGNSTGVVRGKLDEIMLDSKSINTAKQGDVITFKVPSRVRENDEIFLWKDAERSE
jgi:putative protease